jgi:hypothetical protein
LISFSKFLFSCSCSFACFSCSQATPASKNDV